MAWERDWDPGDLVRADIDFAGRGAVQWWGPWAPHGAEGSAGGALARMSRISEGIAGVDLSGWEGSASRAAGEAWVGVQERAGLVEEQLAAAALATRALDEAVREALLHAAGGA